MASASGLACKQIYHNESFLLKCSHNRNFDLDLIMKHFDDYFKIYESNIKIMIALIFKKIWNTLLHLFYRYKHYSIAFQIVFCFQKRKIMQSLTV